MTHAVFGNLLILIFPETGNGSQFVQGEANELHPGEGSLFPQRVYRE